MKSLTLLSLAILSLLAALTHTPVYGQQSDRTPAQSSAEPGISRIDFILSTIDEKVTAEFEKAWRAVGSGADMAEAVVLLYKKYDGSLMARSLPLTREYQKFRFDWSWTIIGVVHTHPNSCGSQPLGEDLRMADRFGVPIFTITNRGMYVYDPITKKISQVQDGLDWLESSKWNRNSQIASNR